MKQLFIFGFLVYASASFSSSFSELEFQRMEERVHDVLKGSQALRTEVQSDAAKRAPASLSEEDQKFFEETENIDKD